MTASKSLPARPSLDSLRKQAKQLARDVAAGDAAAIERVRAHLPKIGARLTRRNAQLVIAREYGFAGWQELTAEVAKRLGKRLAGAVAHARRVIHANDVDSLRHLLTENPALLSWCADEDPGSLLEMATSAYGDAGDAQREEWFTRRACAELLIDAGALVTPRVCEGLLQSRATGLLNLFARKEVLPRTLEFFAALGDLDGVRAALDDSAKALEAVNEGFVCACRFEHEAVAAFLLDRSVALDTELGTRLDTAAARASFIETHSKSDLGRVAKLGLWKTYVAARVDRAVVDGDLTAFVGWLQRENWLLGEAAVELQSGMIGAATLNDREAIITALFEHGPAILERRPPPPSQAIEFALTYANTHLVTKLTRIWPLPDDLPHAAGMGDLARVREWLDPALVAAENHYPYNDPRARSHLQWDTPTAQQVLDVALAFAVINRHFEVADFLFEHGADIDTRWNSHEPASILHHLVFLPNPYERMQYLIDRGIDMTIKDYRWNATAQAWALHALRDEKLAGWLAAAQRQRGATGSS